jgi:hypothetical protein
MQAGPKSRLYSGNHPIEIGDNPSLTETSCLQPSICGRFANKKIDFAVGGIVLRRASVMILDDSINNSTEKLSVYLPPSEHAVGR